MNGMNDMMSKRTERNGMQNYPHQMGPNPSPNERTNEQSPKVQSPDGQNPNGQNPNGQNSNAQNPEVQGLEVQAPGRKPLEPPIACQAALPYPPIRPSKCQPQYAAAMLDNMAGQISELSAVGLYFYDCLLASGLKEAADIFHRISLVEMHHMDIFARLAMGLGENPRLWAHMGRSGRYAYWSAASLRYPPIHPAESGCTISPADLRLLLSQAIEEEQKALNKYMKQTSWILDANICDNLIRIAADEQMHLDILTRLYHKVL